MYKHLPSGGRLIHTFVWKKGTRRSEGLDCKAFKYLLMSCWSQGDTVSTDGASFPYQLLLRCDLQMKYFGWGEEFLWKSKAATHGAIIPGSRALRGNAPRLNNGEFSDADNSVMGQARHSVGRAGAASWLCVPFAWKLRNRWLVGATLLPLPSSGAHFMLTAAICSGLLTWTCGK